MTTTAPTASGLLQSVGLNASILNPDKSFNTSLLSLDKSYTDQLSAFDVVARANGEHFLAKLRVTELQKDAEWILVLTNKSLYKFELNAPLNAPRKRKLLIDYYDVDPDTSNPLQFTTLLYKSNARTAVKSSFMRFMGNLGSKVDLSTLLQRREYVCTNTIQRDQFVFLMSKAVRNCWQEMFESVIIPAPEYYQEHQLVVKINRKGAHQERMLVISNAWLYNIEIHHNPSRVDQVKWSVPIKSFEALNVDCSNCEVCLYFDMGIIKDIVAELKNQNEERTGVITKNNDTYLFQFSDEYNRYKFVTICKYLYKQQTGENLKILLTNQESSIVHNPHVYIDTQQYTHQDQQALLQQQQQQQQVQDAMYAHTEATGAYDNSAEGGAEGSVIRATFQTDAPLLIEPMEKLLNKDGAKSHTKYFALYSDLTIKWGDSPHKFKHTASIISLIKGGEIIDTVASEKRLRFLALRTTRKPLYLITESVNSRATWMTVIESLLAPSVNAAIPAGTNLKAYETTLPVLKGPMLKYTKRGKASHTKYFCVYADGTIKWGESETNLKHTATILEIDQDITSFEGNIAREDAVRYIRIVTNQKDLPMLCPNESSADRWVSVISHMLDPNYQDIDDDDD